MYWAFIEKCTELWIGASALINALADRLLRRKIVVPAILFFLVTMLFDGGDLRWFNDAAVLVLLLLGMLWILTRFERDNDEPGFLP